MILCMYILCVYVCESEISSDMCLVALACTGRVVPVDDDLISAQLRPWLSFPWSSAAWGLEPIGR